MRGITVALLAVATTVVVGCKQRSDDFVPAKRSTSAAPAAAAKPTAPKSTQGPSYETGAAELQLLCEPGVRVWVDGQFAGECTAEAEGLYLSPRPGRRDIRARKTKFNVPWSRALHLQDGPNPEVRIVFKASETKVVDLSESKVDPVVEATGRMVIRSIPPRPRAPVSVNGRPLGRTPLQVDHAAGLVSIRSERLGTVIEGSLRLHPGAERAVAIDFLRRQLLVDGGAATGGGSPGSPRPPDAGVAGRIRIQTEPPGARVTDALNGRMYGETPLEVPRPSSEILRLKLLKEGFRSLPIAITPGMTGELKVKLMPAGQDP